LLKGNTGHQNTLFLYDVTTIKDLYIYLYLYIHLFK